MIAPFLVTASSMLMLAIWFFLDNSWPYWDAASHVMDAIKYKELYRYPHLLDPAWWHSLLTVNYCYPPHIHAFNGFLKLLLPHGLVSDHLSLVLFCGVLSLNTYFIALKLFKNVPIAVFSVLAVNSFPVVCGLSHTPLLDYPHLSMFSLAMLTLILWNEKPGWKTGSLLGIGLGLAVSAKQVAAFFLIGPCLAVFMSAIFKKEYSRVKSLILAGFIALSFVCVWVLPNHGQMTSYTQRNEIASLAGSYILYILDHVAKCLEFMPKGTSPLLFLIFLLTIFAARSKILKPTWLFGLSTTTGVLLLSALPFQHPEERYIIPVYLFIALVIGYGFGSGIQSPRKWLKNISLIAISICIQQTLSFSFTPYPVPLPAIHKYLGANSSCGYHFDWGINPTAADDAWSQKWVIEKIGEVDNNRPGYLYVMPNNQKYNVHTFSLIAKILGSPIKATTSRKFNMTGETSRFLEKEVFYYDWFLFLKSMKLNIDGTCRGPKDQESLKALRSIESFVQNNPKFQKIGERTLPDGNSLLLYRKLNPQ